MYMPDEDQDPTSYVELEGDSALANLKQKERDGANRRAKTHGKELLGGGTRPHTHRSEFSSEIKLIGPTARGGAGAGGGVAAGVNRVGGASAPVARRDAFTKEQMLDGGGSLKDELERKKKVGGGSLKDELVLERKKKVGRL